MELNRSMEEDIWMYDEDYGMDSDMYPEEHSCTENFEISLGFYMKRLEEMQYEDSEDEFHNELRKEILHLSKKLRKKVLALQAYEEYYMVDPQ